MTKTATSASTAPTLTPTATELRTLVAWLRPRVGGVMPADDVAAATPSALAAALSELRRVVRARWRTTPGGRLAELLDEMRHAVLTFDPDPYKLAAQRASATEALAALEVPPVVEARPASWAELARDLGLPLPLPGTVEGARAVLLAAASDANTDDRRARPLWARLVQHVRDGGKVTASTIRLRHALAGFGLPPVRADDPVFNSKPARQELTPEMAPFEGRNIFGGVADSDAAVVALAAGFRIENPQVSDHGEAEAAIVAWRQQVGRDIARRPARTREERSENEKARTNADAEVNKRRRAILDASNARCIKASVAVIAALDKLIGRHASPGSINCYWLRELRRHLVASPVDRSEFEKMPLADVYAICRSLDAVPRTAM
ncbi:MAG: hypothetical protein IPH80_33400 [Myxococcales bacterium]|nr:hypothetical protein [Myxococcales bacterium]